MITHQRKRSYLFWFFSFQLTFLLFLLINRISYPVEINQDFHNQIQHQFKGAIVAGNTNAKKEEILNEDEINTPVEKNVTENGTLITDSIAESSGISIKRLMGKKCH